MKALAPYPFPPSQIGDLYASALATTVLQLKELASRPGSWDGVVGLFDVAEGVGEAEIRAALADKFGTITAYETRAWPPVVVTFATHAAAGDAVQRAALLVDVAGGVDYLFNERAYDERGW